MGRESVAGPLCFPLLLLLRRGGPLAPRGLRTAVVGLVLLAGCKTEFPDDTAEVSLDGRTITFDLEACGLDDDTVFVVGRSEGGAVLQAVIGVEPGDDGPVALPDATGMTVTDDGLEWEAFGEVAWLLRDGEREPPGVIVDVEIDGSRVQVEVTAALGNGTSPAQTVDISLDARCDAPVTA